MFNKLKEKKEKLRQKIILSTSIFCEKKFGLKEDMRYEDMNIFQKILDGILEVFYNIVNFIISGFTIKGNNKIFEALRYKELK